MRCDLLPACYVAPAEIRELRRLLRYRNLVVRQAVRQKNKIAGLLMEVGASYNKRRLHGRKYFSELLETLEEVPPSVKDLLRLSRGALQLFEGTQRQLLARLRHDALLAERVRLLRSIPGVGEVTALTWALEVGEPERFASIAHAVSYCGLTSALRSSAERQQRTPLSKQRNAHLQTVLIEAAKLAPRWNEQLAAVYQRELERGHRNRATLVVARKLVAYLLAVDKSRQPFQMPRPTERAGAQRPSGVSRSELTSGKGCFPRRAARRRARRSRTVLAVQGTLRRATNTARPGRLRAVLPSKTSRRAAPAGKQPQPTGWENTATFCQRTSGRSSPGRGLHRELPTPVVPLCLFRGRPLCSHSIFEDGVELFPQMDVWSR